MTEVEALDGSYRRVRIKQDLLAALGLYAGNGGPGRTRTGTGAVMSSEL